MTYVVTPIMFIGTSFLSAGVNLMGVAFGATTLLTTALLNNNSFRRSFDIPPIDTRPREVKVTLPENSPPAPGSEPAVPTYEAPRQAQSFKQSISSSIQEAKKAVTDKMANASGSVSQSAEEKAEKRRRELIRKLEDKRSQQERENFESKYKKR